MRIWVRRLAWVWLAIGAAAFLHGALTGDGVASALLYSQLIPRHEASPSTVSELLFLPLCLAPIALLLFTYRPPPAQRPGAQDAPPKNLARGLLLGGLFGGMLSLLMPPGGNPRWRGVSIALGAVAIAAFALAAWSLLQQSGGTSQHTANINLDTERALPPVSNARISGTARPQYKFSYLESSELRGTSYGKYHNLVPLTSSRWPVQDLIRVLADFSGELDAPHHKGAFQMSGRIASAPGGYVLRALRDKGLGGRSRCF